MNKNSLTRFLKRKDAVLFGRLTDLSARVAGWLSYIPQTFPHYTRHTIEHSEEIISQLSKLLFLESGKCTLKEFSAMEAYILCAAAYLHDAGMVVSDQSKASLLDTDEWRDWVSESSPGHTRWTALIRLRASTPATDLAGQFRVDTQTRFLIAEFIRRTHHLRAKEVLTSNEQLLGGFSLQEPVLLETIGDVCIAHGLSQEELSDSEKFPERRQVGGYTVNVRFLAILLRIGDLLDLVHDRACPLLENAACPLPADSYAHWSQYKRITHQFTGPDLIELRAECENQLEHRQLADWCGWLTAEVQKAQVVMSHAKRHQGWETPAISMVGANPTIEIKRAPRATYLPYQWKIEIDAESVVERLINDVYSGPLSFVRELIQNGVDATRCKLVSDLRKQGTDKPESFSELGEELREQYALQVSLRIEEKLNLASGEKERRQVVRVEDKGLGMDVDVIQHYLLQVGKSFYKSPDFRKQYGFNANSSFGVGFLSTFAVSDKIVLETSKAVEGGESKPLRLELTGPSSYLLIEQGSRQSTGTSVDVWLRESIAQGDLTRSVESYCKRLEFPIVVSEPGLQKTVRAEKPEALVYERLPIVTKEGATFAVRGFPIQRAGIEGELYVLASVSNGIDSWNWGDWAKSTYPTIAPDAVAPPMVNDLTCINGMMLHGGYATTPSNSRAERLDFRDGSLSPTLSRESRRTLWRARQSTSDNRITSRWAEILDSHLEGRVTRSPGSAWRYMQSLVSIFPLPAYWAGRPGMVPMHKGQIDSLERLNEISALPSIITVSAMDRQYGDKMNTESSTRDLAKSLGAPFVINDELAALSQEHLRALFEDRYPRAFRFCGNADVLVSWGPGRLLRANPFTTQSYGSRYMFPVSMGLDNSLGFKCSITPRESYFIVNLDHPLIAWVVRLSEEASESNGLLTEAKAYSVRAAIGDYLDYKFQVRLTELNNLLRMWSNTAAVEPSLRCPVEAIGPADFKISKEFVWENGL